MTYLESARELPLRYGTHDVVVAGGGIAGISSALAAARAGRTVLLLEREFALGGLATLGLITIYLPLCDGEGHQLCYGIAEELLKLSISRGWERDYPDSWLEHGREHGRQRYQVRYNASVFAILCEQLLREAGVDILYGTMVCGIFRDGERVEALAVENKDGRSAVAARSFVDATGDADLFTLAGCKTRFFGKGNELAAWYYETSDGENSLRMVGAFDIGEDSKQDYSKLQHPRISGLNAKETSDALLAGHAVSLERFLRGGPLTEKHSLSAIASIPQLRMTRCLCGAYELDESEEGVRFPDSVGMTGDWRKRGPGFEIPFRCLYSPELANLAAAGRCISVTDAMWDISRVIPPCAVTGQAAGLAAALGEDLRRLDVTRLQTALRASGVKLHLEEVR